MLSFGRVRGVLTPAKSQGPKTHRVISETLLSSPTNLKISDIANLDRSFPVGDSSVRSHLDV